MNTPLDISQNKPLLWLMAIACGLCAGANYYCQPLINSIHTYFQVPESQVALTVTFAQVSYALGLLFIVPVGDTVNKTKFIPLLMFLAAFGLFLCAFSVNLPMPVCFPAVQWEKKLQNGITVRQLRKKSVRFPYRQKTA